jgi:Radical SAM superfamily
MQVFQSDDLTITLYKEGSPEYQKVSYPIRYGRFGEILTPDYVLQTNLNGEIKYVQGRSPGWPHPAEWLKRTVGNDWIYYSAGDYKGVYDLFGEYYAPVLSYPSNSVFDEHPFDRPAVKSAVTSWQGVLNPLKRRLATEIPGDLRDFLTRFAENDPPTLSQRAEQLHHILGGRVTVLPPDTRHVDYDVIPIMVADGCLYQCGFCRVKSGRGVSLRTRQNILEQIRSLKTFYGRDLLNYNSLYLGEHDALRAGRDVIEFASTTAYDILEFERSYLKTPRLFLFGSVDSMIQAKESLFTALADLPFHIWINVGLESPDPATLGVLKKPITLEKIIDAFGRMLEVNRSYETMEVTANFVFGEGLPQSHLDALMEFIRSQSDVLIRKGGIYLSPFADGKRKGAGRRRAFLRRFNEVKTASHLPTFIYLIQRL